MADNKGVMICGECVDGNLASVSTELLGIGRKLANDLGEELCAVVLGENVGKAAFRPNS